MEKYDALVEADNYKSEDYQGVFRLIAILDGGTPTTYGADVTRERLRDRRCSGLASLYGLNISQPTLV
ncbi:hypothetical protein FRB97_004071, partial [Tulasnella sp. 331]